MDATNLVIHIFALISFVFLIWIMLKSIGNQRFLKRCALVSRDGAKGFILNRPQTFVEDFGRSMGYPVHFEGSNGPRKYVRCRPAPWFEFIIHHGIESVSVKESSDKILVTINSHAKKQTGIDWPNIFTESVGGAATIDVNWRGE